MNLVKAVVVVLAVTSTLGCNAFREAVPADAANTPMYGDARVGKDSAFERIDSAAASDAYGTSADVDAGIDAEGAHLSIDASACGAPDVQYTNKIVFTSTRDGTPHIYVANADGTNIEQLTTGPDEDSSASWSPDNRRIQLAVSGPREA